MNFHCHLGCYRCLDRCVCGGCCRRLDSPVAHFTVSNYGIMSWLMKEFKETLSFTDVFSFVKFPNTFVQVLVRSVLLNYGQVKVLCRCRFSKRTSSNYDQRRYYVLPHLNSLWMRIMATLENGGGFTTKLLTSMVQTTNIVVVKDRTYKHQSRLM